MEPPMFTILVEAISEESVVTTRLRAMGAARRRDLGRDGRRENAVGLHGGDGAGGIDGGVALHENHSGHIAGFQLRVIRARRGGATLSGDETVALQLRRKLT